MLTIRKSQARVRWHLASVSTTLRFFTKQNCWVLANPTQQPCLRAQDTLTLPVAGTQRGALQLFVLSRIIWSKVCWPSRMSVSWKNHPSRKTFFFLFPMFPFLDEPLLPGSQWPWAPSFSPKLLPLVLLHRRDLPKSRTGGGEHLHVVYIPYTICHLG